MKANWKWDWACEREAAEKGVRQILIILLRRSNSSVPQNQIADENKWWTLLAFSDSVQKCTQQPIIDHETETENEPEAVVEVIAGGVRCRSRKIAGENEAAGCAGGDKESVNS